MHTLYEKRHISSTECAVFRIPLSGRPDVFMRAERRSYNAEKRAVVEVDAARFLTLWRRPHSSHSDIAAGSPETWITDRKYVWAGDGFAHGAENPVPLAEVKCGLADSELTERRRRFLIFSEQLVVAPKGLPWLAFSNGVARTIWLLSHGAKVFPVECPVDDATRLHELAGTGGAGPVRIADLIS